MVNQQGKTWTTAERHMVHILWTEFEHVSNDDKTTIFNHCNERQLTKKQLTGEWGGRKSKGRYNWYRDIIRDEYNDTQKQERDAARQLIRSAATHFQISLINQRSTTTSSAPTMQAAGDDGEAGDDEDDEMPHADENFPTGIERNRSSSQSASAGVVQPPTKKRKTIKKGKAPARGIEGSLNDDPAQHRSRFSAFQLAVMKYWDRITPSWRNTGPR